MTAKGEYNSYKCLVDLSVPKWVVSHQRRTSIDCVSSFLKVKILTFLCSLAFLGLSGVCEPLAGAPAIGDAVCFSIVSAGIVKTSKKKVLKSKSSLETKADEGGEKIKTKV